jgi:DNA-binding transcriptional LysR family regulator
MALDLNLVRAFIAVHELGSFSAAASRLGVPRSTVSRSVAALEEALGVTLFHRTTRRVAATAAGTALHDRVVRPLGALEASLADLPEREEEPAGVLRVTATADVATVLLSEAVTRFTARYPNTEVEMRLSNTMLDLVGEQFDLALRISASPLSNAALISRKLGTIAFQLYAAPGYLARAGTPRSLDELSEHELIAFRGFPPLRMGSNADEIRGRARVTCDDMFFALAVTRQGVGIARLPAFVADADVAAGTLLRVIPRWSARAGTIYMVQPGRKHVPRRLTAFRDLLLEIVRKRPF